MMRKFESYIPYSQVKPPLRKKKTSSQFYKSVSSFGERYLPSIKMKRSSE